MGITREKLCARLRVLRAERGLSQENVADMVGMSLPGYAKIERGNADLSLDRVEQIALAFGVGVADLLGAEAGTMNISHTGAGNVIGRDNKVDSVAMAELVRELFERVVRLERELATKEGRNGA